MCGGVYGVLYCWDGVSIVKQKNKWQIPYKSGTSDYARAFVKCRKFNKPYPELTYEEKMWEPTKVVHKTKMVAKGDVMTTAITELTEELAALSLEIQELRIAIVRAAKNNQNVVKP